MFTIQYSKYTSIVGITLTFGLACWGVHLLKSDRVQLTKIIKTLIVVIGKEQEDIETVHEHRTLSKTKKILNDKTHSFYPIHE